MQEVEVATPVAKTTGYKVAGDIFVVPILRAGLGLLTGVLKMIPDARVGFIGLYRDEETLKPIEYYCKLPDNKDGVTIVVGNRRQRCCCDFDAEGARFKKYSFYVFGGSS